MSLIVHVNGWPGTGKLTIAGLLAARLDARLVDNHATINPAAALFPRSDPAHHELFAKVRALVLDYAARLPAEAALVFTDALSDDEFDTARFDEYRQLAARRSASLVAVIFDCDPIENARRLVAPGRAEQRKLVKPEVLARMRETYRLHRPGDLPLIELDVTALSPGQAAEEILSRLPV